MMILLKSSRNVVKDEPMSFEEKWAKQGRKPKRNSNKVETKGERKKERKKR